MRAKNEYFQLNNPCRRFQISL